jgi:2-methylcitrate dehydratase PrpD
MSRHARSLTRKLAELIVQSDPLNDAAALEAAREGVLDWFASILAARSDCGADKIEAALGVPLRQRESEAPHVPSSTVIGRGYRLPPPDAALINGYLSHALDYDDVHESMRGHPSAVLLPALMAEAEARRLGGADVLSAYVIGVETMCRLGLALGRRHYEAGWHNTATIGAVGAAAACARLIGLDAEKTVHAVSLAATQSAGLRVQFGSDAKPLHAGLAARAGLLAARLAASGVQGAEEPLAGKIGFLSIFGGGQAVEDKVVDSWGQPWQIVEPGLWLKLYPCCSAAHHAADAALAIRAAHAPDPAGIADVTTAFPPGGDAALVIREPKTGVEGRFSVEYVIAAALIHGELGLDTFSDRPVDESVRALARKVRRVYDGETAPAPEAMPKGRFTIVTVTMKDGTSYTERVDCPRGAPGRPLSAEERLLKYEDAVQGLPEPWHALPSRIARLERIADISDLLPDI